MLLNTPAVDAPIYSSLVGAAPLLPSQDTLVATAHSLDIFQPATILQTGANPQPLLIGKITKDNLGNVLDLTGTYTKQMVFNDDGTLVYIAGNGGKVYVFDTMTQDIVATYSVQGAVAPISSLALNDGWLYVAEGSNYGTGRGRLLRVNVDSSGPQFLKLQQTLNLPAGVTAPYGFRDMAVNKGRYLAITAPTGRIFLTNYGPALASGNVYVIDLYGVTASDQVDASVVATLDLSNYPSATLGKGPLYITSGDERGQFLVSNAKDVNNGAAGITFATDPINGNLKGGSALVDPRLTPSSIDLSWLQSKDQQNIQRAAGTVIVNYWGHTYALVADYNFLFNDPHYVDDENFGLGKQIGGKIGVIEDPFGTYGGPVYLGATTPIPDVAFDQLTLDQSGMLYASAFVEDTSGQYTGGFISDLMYHSMFVWNAGQLVQAALDAKQAGRNLSVPIDRLTPVGAQLPAVKSARYDMTADGKLFGWIYGVGAYSDSKRTPSITLQDVPYLQELAPSLFTEAKSAAVAAHVPVAAPELDTKNGTWNTLLIRTTAHMAILSGTLAGSVQALFGKDNSQMLAQIDDAQQVLNTIGYDVQDQSTFAKLTVGPAAAIEGLIGGIVLIETNAAGLLMRHLPSVKNPNLPAPTEYLQMLDSGATTGQQANYLALAFLKYNPVTLTAEGLYKMSGALAAKNYALFAYESFQVAGLMATLKWDSTPLAKRELQLEFKEMAFLKQQLTRGVIEEAPLRAIEFKPEGTEAYVIESARKNAAGEVISEPRVVTVEDFAKEKTGSLEMTPANEVLIREPIISRIGKEIVPPERGTMTTKDSFAWFKEQSQLISREMMDKSWSPLERATETKRLMNELKTAQRNAMIESADVLLLERIDPIKSLKEDLDGINQKSPGDKDYNIIVKRENNSIYTYEKKFTQEKERLDKIANELCFGAGTLIHTKNGLVPIEEISVGDLVLSQPENKGPLSYKPVTHTFVHYNADVRLVEFTSRVEFNRAMSLRTMLPPEATNWIVVTGNHPFFVKDRGWVEARNLGSACEVELSDGNYALSTFNASIHYSGQSPQTGFAPFDYQWSDGGVLAHFWPGPLRIEHIHGSPKIGAQLPCMPKTVYNFEVQDDHTYYVGAMGMWAHNKETHHVVSMREVQELKGENPGRQLFLVEQVTPEELAGLSEAQKYERQTLGIEIIEGHVAAPAIELDSALVKKEGNFVSSHVKRTWNLVP